MIPGDVYWFKYDEIPSGTKILLNAPPHGDDNEVLPQGWLMVIAVEDVMGATAITFLYQGKICQELLSFLKKYCHETR